MAWVHFGMTRKARQIAAAIKSLASSLLYIAKARIRMGISSWSVNPALATHLKSPIID